MGIRIQIVSVLAAGLLWLFVFELVRRRRLMERYAMLWLFSATVLLAMAAWKSLLERFADAIGIYYAPSALFVVALGCIAVLLLHFSLVISRLVDQSKVLAQRLSLLQQRVDELETAQATAAAEAEQFEEPALPRARRASLRR